METGGILNASDYRSFFHVATGVQPYDYQLDIATGGLPDLLEVPTGAGKSAAVVLGWLWRRVGTPDPTVWASTPRQLAVAMPMRTLVDQLAEQVVGWLENLDLADRVDLHVVMGGKFGSQRAWRIDMHRPSIVIGTTDTIVSKGLFRAYGASRASYPIDFALIGNGTHIVLDELQLAPQTCVTLRQLNGFAAIFGTTEPSGLTCMSATVIPQLLDTVDNPWLPAEARIIQLDPAQVEGELARRLAAQREIRPAAVESGNYPALAKLISANHLSGTRTLAIFNSVDAALAVTTALDRLKPAAPVVLLHSRFRPPDRAAAVTQAVAEVDPDGPGVIVISTQVVEAGVDITSRTLFIEAAPWTSVIQRIGRCNRFAETTDARVYWCAPMRPAPYEAVDVAASVAALTALEGSAVTVPDLLSIAVDQSRPDPHVLRRKDFVDLFDTTPDLSGNDLDVGRYIRDADDLDASVAWLQLDGIPQLRGRNQLPGLDERCPVPLRLASELAKDRQLWRYDPENDRWFRHLTSSARIRPGEVMLLNAADGGYLPRFGLMPKSTTPVTALTADADPLDSIQGASTEDAGADEGAVDALTWELLDDHLAETAVQARALLDTLNPDLAASYREAIIEAARLHDIGKAFEPWQAALRSLGGDQAPDAEPVYAKSPVDGRLELPDHPGFRHEVMTALILRSHPDLAQTDASLLPLVRYLAAAHHGRVRVQGRNTLVEKVSGSKRSSEAAAPQLLGLREGDTASLRSYLGFPASELPIDLDEFRLGGTESWTREALRLLDELGPFRLAYLEAVVRIADWRASAHVSIPEGRPQ